MRLIDADFEINHYLSMITNPTPDVTMYDKQHALAIVDALKMAKTVDTGRKKGEWLRSGNCIFPYECDQCGDTNERATPFCPNCGAELR